MDDEQAYRETTFEADTPVGRVEIRIGARDGHLERLLEFHSAREWGFLTAWNPKETFTEESENRRRQEDLEKRLRDRGFTIYSGEAVPDPPEWAPEQAVLVVGLPRDSAIELAQSFSQKYVVWGRSGESARLLEVATGNDVSGPEQSSEEPDVADEVLGELGGTVGESVERYRSEPIDSMENAVDWEIVLRSLDDNYSDPDLD